MAEGRGRLRHAVPRAVAVVLDHDDRPRRRNLREEFDDHVDGAVAQPGQVRRLPISLEAGWPEEVGHPLRRVVRHRLKQIGERRAVVAQRAHGLLPFLDRTGIDAAETDERGAAQRRRRGRVIRKMKEERTLCRLVRRARFEIAPPPQRGRRLVGRMQDDAGQHGSDRMRREGERRHDSEVTSSAADRPEQIIVVASVRRHDTAIGQHDVGGEQVVQREPVFANQPPETAAEGQARHAGHRHEAAGRGQTVRLKRVVHLGPVAAALGADRARIGIDGDRSHSREIDHEPFVAHREAGDVVAGAANRDDQALVDCKPDGVRHVARVGAPSDQPWPPIDRRIEDRACSVVPLVAGCEELATKDGSQTTDGGCSDHGDPPSIGVGGWKYTRSPFCPGRNSASTRSARSDLAEDLPQMMLQVPDVVAHEVIERRRLAGGHRLPRQLVEVVPGERLGACRLRDRRHDAREVPVIARP